MAWSDMKKSSIIVFLVLAVTAFTGWADLFYFDSNNTTNGWGLYQNAPLSGDLWKSTDNATDATTTFGGAGATTNDTAVFTIDDSSFSGNSQYISDNFDIGGIVWRGSAVTSRNNVGFNGNTFTFSPGATVDVADVYSGNAVDLSFSSIDLVGDFTKSGAGGLLLRDNTLNGMLTIEQGRVNLEPNPCDLGQNSRINIGSGAEMALGWAGIAGALRQTSIGGLAGPGLFSGGSGNDAATNEIIISHGHGLDFSGEIDDGLNNVVRVKKTGPGTQTFSGTNTYQGTTVVGGGTLVVNGLHDGRDAYHVTNGTLSGGGYIRLNEDINIEDDGTLDPGNGTNQSIDVLTLTLGLGDLDVSDIAGTDDGDLVFDLGASTTPGVTYDHVNIETGQLVIGDGLLGFDDFNFREQAGFGQGDYILFSTQDGITGTLSAANSGTIGALPGSIGIDGNNMVLTVIPEPSVIALLLSGFALLRLRRRKPR